MNQCDGCMGGVETYTRDGITYHVMGRYRTGFFGRFGMKDIMVCERERYTPEFDKKWERDDAGNEIYIGGEPLDGDKPPGREGADGQDERTS